MIFRIIFFVFLGYILVKTFRYLTSIFKAVNPKSEGERVYEADNKVKIDEKDVIEAQFEEIDEKEKE